MVKKKNNNNFKLSNHDLTKMTCLVTGGSGFVGRRLVEMLIEYGCKKVISFDIRMPITTTYTHLNYLNSKQEERIEYITGDLTDKNFVINSFKNVDAVFHIAAVVGPYYPKPLYRKVNYEGTLNVIEACKTNSIRYLVSSSSPSTRFFGNDISGKSADELPIPPPGKFTAPYAETKAMGEMAVRLACSEDLLTINVAPHQVYGPRDTLFLPNFMLACKSRKLRVIGTGKNKVSMCHVDNYAHGLILGLDSLYIGSPSLGRFYIITDNEPQYLWKILDQGSQTLGYGSIWSKMFIPAWFMFIITYILGTITMITGTQFRLSTFAVLMLIIDRYFNIDKSIEDLKYEPIYTFEEGWSSTLEWFKENEDFWIDQASTTQTRGKALAKQITSRK